MVAADCQLRVRPERGMHFPVAGALLTEPPDHDHRCRPHGFLRAKRSHRIYR